MEHFRTIGRVSCRQIFNADLATRGPVRRGSATFCWLRFLFYANVSLNTFQTKGPLVTALRDSIVDALPIAYNTVAWSVCSFIIADVVHTLDFEVVEDSDPPKNHSAKSNWKRCEHAQILVKIHAYQPCSTRNRYLRQSDFGSRRGMPPMTRRIIHP